MNFNSHLGKNSGFLALILGVVSFFSIWISHSSEPVNSVSANKPPIGPPEVKDRGRIVQEINPSAVVHYKGQYQQIRFMVQNGIQKLTGSQTRRESWMQIIAPGETVGIFVAPYGWHEGSTLIPIVDEIIQGLQSTGMPTENIFIWSRNPKDTVILKKKPGITLPSSQFIHSVQNGYDSEWVYESPIVGSLIWSDKLFKSEDPDAGRYSHVSQLLTKKFDRIILVNSLSSDRGAGIRGHLFSLCYAGVDNFNRFLNYPGILSEAVPEIFTMEPLADKTCLFITDALIGSVVGHKPGTIHYHPPVNELWLSRDPVALDSYSMMRANSLRKSIGFKEFSAESAELLFNSQIMELGLSETNKFQIVQ